MTSSPASTSGQSFTALLVVIRMRLRSTNILERLTQEARRREKVIRNFPDERSAWRLLGALRAEQHELWITGRRWLAMDDYWEWKKKRETEDLERAA